MNLKLAMEEPWYKEYWTFLMIPFLSTVACYFIPLFRCEEGLSYMSVLPLTAAFSYGHTLSPRKPYYEKSWKKLMDYSSFIEASLKRVLIFSIPTGLGIWGLSLFLKGYTKELSMVFEASVWGLSTAICLAASFFYIDELRSVKKQNVEKYKNGMNFVKKLIIPSAIGLASIAFLKNYTLLQILFKRS
jgi:hypothetical protein